MAGKVTPMAKYKLVFLGDQSVRCLRVAAPDLLCYVCVFLCARARTCVCCGLSCTCHSTA